MDLIDLIGDTRTDSLPPGFLRSIKLKYKQESSRVFPPGTPWKNKTNAAIQVGPSQERVKSAASSNSTPSFMNWDIPSRVINKYKVEKKETFPSGKVIRQVKEEQDVDDREAVYSRMSTRSHKSLGSVKSATALQAKLEREKLPRVEPVRQQTPFVRPLASPQKALPSPDRTNSFGRKKMPAAVDRWLRTASRQEKAVVSKVLSAADVNVIKEAAGKVIQPKAVEAVERWMTRANDIEKEIALKFFSNLAGTKLDIGGTDIKCHRSHAEGTCHACGRGKIEDALDALARGDQTHSGFKSLYNPSRPPNLHNSSHYNWTKERLPPTVRQQFQTWHHLPVYAEPNGAVPNKSAMFTQPHKYYGRHFTIHPEWGFHRHKPLALK